MLGGVLSVKHAVGLRAFAVFKFDGTRLPTDEGVVTGVWVRIPPPARLTERPSFVTSANDVGRSAQKR